MLEGRMPNRNAMKWAFVAMLFASCFAIDSKNATHPVVPQNGSARNQHPTCKQSEVEHSDVIHDRGLGNINPKNYTFLGNVPTMNDCMAMCCSTKHCNIAYMKNNSCFGVTCLEKEKCMVKNGTLESGTKLALMIRNEMNRRVYVTAYLVVVVCAFGAALAGTVWAVFVFYKRYSSVRPGDDEEESELLKQPKVRNCY
ncbi:uncharacterized protein LOC135684784 isoform X1 [Rhopilema esculentum]|uniref:uncharacterized protein LOC135684784 isoform X1 n=1 Tax=Rhopilema esculentum TaxID=499914 RepID=UPI0031DC3970